MQTKNFLGEQFVCGGTLTLNNCKCSRKKGVYIVVYNDKNMPEFNAESLVRDKIKNGKTYKSAFTTDRLKFKEWVDNADILYIGKADCLQDRIIEKIECWNGNIESYYTWGGRLIAQINNFGNLDVWYMECDAPISRKKELIEKFIRRYNKLPFANLKR